MQSGSDALALLTIAALVEAQVDRRPAGIAVVSEDGELTFAALDARANRLAHALIARGAGPDRPVLVMLERSLDLVVALLAILKSGAPYLPIDPRSPPDRTRRVASDARALLAVCRRASDGPLAGLPVDRVHVDDAALELLPASRPNLSTDPDDLAYVLYTSGSTGQPKGVMITHRALTNHMRWMVDALQFDANDVVLQRTPYVFDASGWELWVPLVCGARMIVVAPDRHGDPRYLVALIRHHRVTTVQFVPSLLAAILDHESLADTALTRVACGGEALTGGLVRRIDAPPACEIINLYGPTEVTIDATMSRVDRDRVQERTSIGVCVDNTTAHVLDQALQPVPTAEAGELYLGGIQLARGYLGKPSLTAERFVPDPFGAPGTRLYRTGDLARGEPGGAISYLGRRDHQVKLRGFRIELGEIEAQLRASPLVSDAAVILRADIPGREQLVAYVVLRAATTELGEIRTMLAATFPDYMVPNAFVSLPALPLTPTGKLDRAALPPPATSATGGIAPRTALEEAVGSIWSTLLELSEVGVEDDFFALGGNSLLAIAFLARIGRRFGRELDLMQFVERPTVAATARALAALGALTMNSDTSAGVRERGEREGGSFPIQDLFYGVQQTAPSAFILRLRMAWNLRGPLDTASMQRAVSVVTARHESLRTRFFVRDHVLRQHVLDAPPASAACAFYDLERAAPSAANDAITAQFASPLDLERGEVMRAALCRLGPEDHRLELTIHHVSADGPTVPLVFDELRAAYDALRSDPQRSDARVRPPLPFQFLDVVGHLRDLERSDVGRASYEFWMRAMDGAEPIRLPTDFPWEPIDRERETWSAAPLPYKPTYSCKVVTTSRDGLGAEVQRAFSRGVTPLAYLLAGLGVLVHRESGQTDVCVTSSLNLRPLLDAEQLVGTFNQALYFRVDMATPSTNAELITRVQRTTREAMRHSLAPVTRWVSGRLGMINLGYAGAEDRRPRRIGSAVATDVAPTAWGNLRIFFDLRPTVTIDGDRLLLTLLYNDQLFREATAQRLANSYVEILSNLVNRPDDASGAGRS